MIATLGNLSLALQKDEQKTCCIVNSGDLLVSLPKIKCAILLALFSGVIILRSLFVMVGRQKGMTKTNRCVRERYTWPGLRNQMNHYIRNFRCYLKNKLMRARTYNPVVIIDTSFGVFDRVSVGTVEKLPRTPNWNRHIITM